MEKAKCGHEADTDMLEDDVPKKKKKGGGGPWRAYIHEMVQKQNFKGAMPELAKKYTELPQEEKLRLGDVGAAATAAHVFGATTFPIRSRRRRFARGTGHEILPWDGTKDEIKLPESLSVDISAGVPVAMPRAVKADGTAMSSHDRIHLLARTLSAEAKQANVRQQPRVQEMAQELRQYSAGNVEAVLQNRRGLTELPFCQWEAVPHHPSRAHLEANFLPEAVLSKDDVEEQVRFAQGHTVAELADSWRRTHVMVKEDRCHVQDRAPQKMLFWQHHCCHCRRNQGSFLSRVHTRFANYLKKLCKDKEIESAFVEGLLVLEWCLPGDSEDEAATHHFTHVPLAYLRPWRPTLARLRLDTIVTGRAPRFGGWH